MIRQPLSTPVKWTLQILSVVILVALYTLISHRQHVENPTDTTIPSWGQLAEGVKQVVEVNPREGERFLVMDSLATAERFFLGMTVGVSLAFVLGVLMGCFATCEHLLAPSLLFFAKIPPTAALAVFFVMVGTELSMYVTMVAFGILPSLAISIYLACRDVPEQALHKAYTLGASQTEVIWNVVVRQILPKFVESVRLQIGPALVYLIAAEMVCAGEGFGYRIRLQFKKLDMNTVYPYLIILALFGFLMDIGLKALQRKGCPWYRNEGKTP